MLRLIRASLFLLGLSALALAQYTSQRIAGFVPDPGDSPVPNIIGDWRAGGGTRKQWFNTSAFALPARGTFGKLGRNVVIGPGTDNWDASLQNEFLIKEAIRAAFRAEFYNAPHHLSYTAVAATLGASNFGQVTGDNHPRTL